MRHVPKVWLAAGLALTGCGQGSGDAGTTKPEVTNATPATPAAKVEIADVAMPGNLVGAAAFLEAPEAFEGRVAITGAVAQLDAAKQRFLLCDQSEAG